MGDMTGFIRSGSFIVAFAVLDSGSRECDPNDEVLVAADNWANATRLIRGQGYRTIPKRPGRMKPDPDSIALAIKTPGIVYRRKWAAGEQWNPLNNQENKDN
ncbi:hypothetical protein ACIQGO_32635 [Streptomyces shenzhenensis]|uniref:hypothetical protein n=1 Tax=Streptomyces shenzhenensis TaxID=943815 RepID=UPI0037F66343